MSEAMKAVKQALRPFLHDAITLEAEDKAAQAAIDAYLSAMPGDVRETVERLRIAANFSSMASKMAANEKAARNRLAGDEDAVYSGMEPEETTDGRAADMIEAQAARIAELENAEHGVCDGCGSSKSLKEIRATGHISCCPERRMLPAKEWYKRAERAKAAHAAANAKIAELEQDRADWEDAHSVVVSGFMQMCEHVGVKFDAPEAVASEINTMISNAERRANAAELALKAANAKNEKMREALRKSEEGWANVIEFRLIPSQHIETAETLRDECRAILAEQESAE